MRVPVDIQLVRNPLLFETPRHSGKAVTTGFKSAGTSRFTADEREITMQASFLVQC